MVAVLIAAIMAVWMTTYEARYVVPLVPVAAFAVAWWQAAVAGGWWNGEPIPKRNGWLDRLSGDD